MAFEVENDILKRVYDINEEEIIYVPDNVKTIASGAFHNLTITEVFVPDSVELIEKKAFVNCYIKKISIPENIDITGVFVSCINACLGTISANNCPEIERRKRTTKTTVVEEVHDVPAKLPETDYKQLFLELAYIKELSEKEKVLDSIYNDDDVKIPFAVYLFTVYKSEKAEEYISANFQKVMHYLVDKQDLNGINMVMSIKNKEQTI
ncbi:MAG: leucine-rich repeat domain-containing protein [Ruminococcus sp.]|nr:leucine-rich repeat domain-containing protein [Ruminococcus sp.]